MWVYPTKNFNAIEFLDFPLIPPLFEFPSTNSHHRTAFDSTSYSTTFLSPHYDSAISSAIHAIQKPRWGKTTSVSTGSDLCSNPRPNQVELLHKQVEEVTDVMRGNVAHVAKNLEDLEVIEMKSGSPIVIVGADSQLQCSWGKVLNNFEGQHSAFIAQCGGNISRWDQFVAKIDLACPVTADYWVYCAGDNCCSCRHHCHQSQKLSQTVSLWNPG